MTVLKNELLFNQTYLQQLTTDSSIDAEIRFSPRDLHDWYGFLDTTSTETVVRSWIAPMLSLLELELRPGSGEDPRTYLLTSAYDHQAQLGICYIAPPGADLDTTTKGNFWMAQAVLAARKAETPLRWVILTNGDLWRLLDSQALRRYEAYVQIDVGQLARGVQDPSALRVFFRCFFRTAFVKGPDGQSGLERLLAASDHATEQAEKHLKARISDGEGIMAQLCMGLVRSTGKSSFTEAERDAIYRDATALLYRMLFLLYAEARGLLPIENAKYAANSMGQLVNLAHNYRVNLGDPDGQTLWTILKRLCNAIYESDPELGIPAYNGGLFDDSDHPYLRNGFIADQYLWQAIFDLAFLPDTNGNGRINYRDLSVRHLGSLYEGMIEYKLFVAEQPMLARRDEKSIIHFFTQTEVGGLRRNDQEISAGSVYFAQSSGERRATGTYYTPEYIVDFIVSNTVVRGLEERRAPMEEKLKTWLEEIKTVDADEKDRMHRTVDDELLKFVEEQVLTFHVCDPAMGSGHFLVNAAHHITDFIVETLSRTSWENPFLDLVPDYWRRRAAELCLYGVDLSEMAVELAKLSLWLATMAEGKPLSFLKHHLRQGNSLIGVRLQDLAAVVDENNPAIPSRKEKKVLASGQLSMLEVPAFQKHLKNANKLLTKISIRVPETLADVKNQESDFDNVQIEFTQYRRLANLFIARHFGLIVKEEVFARIAGLILEDLAIQTTDRQCLEQADLISKQRHFFTWPLEYPEIFLNNKQHSNGFNVVIGNPPYGFQFEITEKKYCSATSSCNYHARKPDLYIFFLLKGASLCDIKGMIGMITPNAYQEGLDTVEVREFLFQHFDLVNLVELPGGGVWPDASAECSISILQGEKGNRNCAVLIADSKQPLLSLIDYDLGGRYSLEQLEVYKPPMFSIQPRKPKWLSRVTDECIRLDDIYEVSQGIIAYGSRQDSQKRSYTHAQKLGTEWKPLLNSGDQLKRYSIDEPKIFIRYGKWLHRPHNPKFYENPKLLYHRLKNKEMSRRLTACVDTSRIYNLNNFSNIICRPGTKYSIYFLLAVFNSQFMNWWFGESFQNVNIQEGFIRQIPITKINFSSKEREWLSTPDNLTRLYDRLLTIGNVEDVFPIFEEHILQRYQESVVIHDLLAYLAEQMVGMNQKKQTEVKSFITWLENQTSATLDEMSGKSAIRNFLGDDQKGESYLRMDELLAILAKNQRRLAVDPSERSFQQVLAKRYQQSLDVLLPIKERLAMTDRLIDQIVYKLYGLTDEEISMVEGRFS